MGYKMCFMLFYISPGESLSRGKRVLVTDKDIRVAVKLYNDVGVSPICLYVSHDDGETLDVDCEEDVDQDSDTHSLDNVSSDDDELIDVRLTRLKEVINDPCGALLEKKNQEFAHNEEGDGDGSEDRYDEDVRGGVANDNWDDIGDGLAIQKGEEMYIEQPLYEDEFGNTRVDGYESEYRDSDNYDSPDSSEEEVDKRMKETPRFTTYYPFMDPFKYEPSLQMRFMNLEQLKYALKCFAVTNGYALRFVRRSPKNLTLDVLRVALWRLYASPLQNEASWLIKTLANKHICEKQSKLKIATCNFWAKVYQKRVIQNPKWKLKELSKDIIERYGIEVEKSQASKIRKIFMGEVESTLKEHYAKVWRYGVELLRSNPESTMKINVESTPNGKRRFKSFYVCFRACRMGWKVGCRPIIGFDGAFLKGYYKGVLLTCVGRDGNNQMYPIAWVVVEDENKDSWLWFIDLVRTDLNYTQGLGLTVCSDQQKVLLLAIQELLPLTENRKCARHIYANFRKTCKSACLKALFWQACNNGTPEEFENMMDEMHGFTPDGVKWLRDHGPKTWSRAYFFYHCCCDSVEKNMCEVFNGVLLDAKPKPLITLLEDIRSYVMTRIRKQAELMDKLALKNRICPRIRKKLTENNDERRFWETYFNGEDKYEVRCGTDGYVVNLKNKTCTCRIWQLNGIPCTHACAAIGNKRLRPETFVHECYIINTTKMAYNYKLEPTNGEKLWPQSDASEMLPPLARRMPGRPKQCRQKYLSKGGVGSRKKSFTTKVSRVGRIMTCTNCGIAGHKKKTCKAPLLTNNMPLRSNGSKKVGPTKEHMLELVDEGIHGPSIQTQASQQKKSRTRVRKRVPVGIGLYSELNTGNQYLKLGSKKGKWLEEHTTMDIDLDAPSSQASQPQSASVEDPSVKEDIAKKFQASKKVQPIKNFIPPRQTRSQAQMQTRKQASWKP